MKILLAGDWRWEPYEPACAAALTALGHDVHRFAFSPFFECSTGRYQHALAALPGPSAHALNRALAHEVEAVDPDIVFVWRGTHVWPRTLRRLRNGRRALVSYNNDDPFSISAHNHAPWHHRFLWTWYLRGLRHFDVNFVYRPVNVQEAIRAGARNAHVLMPYFIPALHRPVELSREDAERYACDAVFVGHYEPDGREEYLRALVHTGIKVRLFGGEYWTPAVLGDMADYFGRVRTASGSEYAKALCGARICLAFFSKLNRDTYTRRCFEIPATGRLLLCERSEDMKRLFREDEEAVYFSSPAELAEKAAWLIANPDELSRIAAAGLRRVHDAGHDVTSRMREMLRTIETASLPRGLHHAAEAMVREAGHA